jgi:hypothetical protein
LDVEVLQGFLNAYFGDDRLAITGQIDANTDRAIRDWQRDAGLVVDGQVDPARFIRIEREFTVAEIRLSVGLPAPALGEVVLLGADRLESFTVMDAEPVDATATDYVFLASGESLNLAFDGSEWSAANSEEALALALAFEAALDPAPSGEQMSAGADESGREVVIDGRLALASPVDSAGLPASAVVPDANGTACVWLAREGASSAAKNPLEKVEGLDLTGISATGVALVSATELVGRDLLLNPAEFADTSTCQ